MPPPKAETRDHLVDEASFTGEVSSVTCICGWATKDPDPEQIAEAFAGHRKKATKAKA